MPITVICSQCSTTLRAPDTAAGKNAKCPTCGATLVVPGAAAEATVQPLPESPPPMASAPRHAIEDDDRPRRPRRDDGDYDDRGPRRWRRRDAESNGTSSSSNGV